jgi:tetratricopeptide (TPR) repeat protein
MVRRDRLEFWLVVAVGVVLLSAWSPAQAGDRKSHSYAFLVACSGYNKTELKPLPYTINDIQEFRAVLLESGFEAEDIKILHDKQSERRYFSEKAKILKELQLLLKGLHPDDTLIVALSGHGVHFKGYSVGYFCPVDAELADKSTLLPMEGEGGLFEMLKACPAKRRLLLVNACRNDPASDLAQAAKKINLDDEDKDNVPEGIAALYSCQQGDKSYYDPDRKMGLFFYHLCKAWRGEYQKEAAPLNLEDLFQQVTRETKKDADKTFGATQIPVIKREYGGEWQLDQGVGAARASLRRGKALLDQHQYEDAVAALSEAIRVNPRESSAHAWRGYARLYRSGRNEALADAEEAVKLAPRDSLGYAVRSLVYNWIDDNEAAQKDADRAVQLSDQSVLARVARMRTLANRGKHGEALQEAEAALRIDRNSALAHLTRGVVYFMKKDYDQAVADYTRAIEIDPKYARAYNSRGGAYKEKKDYDRAVADYTRAVEIDPKYTFAYNNRGAAHFEKKDYDQAVADYTRAIELDPKYAFAYNNRGVACTAKKDYDRAVADCSRAIELDPKYAWAYFNRGVAYNWKKDYDRAVADYTKAIELDPKFVWVYRNRAFAYHALGRTTEAAADLRKASELE